MASHDTKNRLLDAAETLFSENGVGATSLRAITSEAGTNLAAVNYHFGSKLGLVKAVFDRGLGPLNRERLRLLAEAEGGSSVPDLETILRAMVVPTVRMLRERAEAGSEFPRLLGRAHFEPDPALRRLIVDSFEDAVARFVAALQRCLPDLSSQELFMRFFFAVGAMMIFTDLKMMSAFDGVAEILEPPETLADELVAFLSAGFRSAPTPAAGVAS